MIFVTPSILYMFAMLAYYIYNMFVMVVTKKFKIFMRMSHI